MLRWLPWFRARDFWERGEDLAVRHLRRNGYRILDRNVRLAGYEIDIIAREGDTVAFVEVKTRRSNAAAEPEESVGKTKQRHIRRAAHHYISRHGDRDTYYRFDIVSVLLPENGRPTVNLIRNAFPDQ